MLENLLFKGLAPVWTNNNPLLPTTLAYGSAGQIGNAIWFLARDESGSPYKYALYRLLNGVVTQMTTVTGAILGARMFVSGNLCFVIGFGTGTNENRQLRYYDTVANQWANSITYPKPLIWSAVCSDGNFGYFCGSGARNDIAIGQFDVSNPSAVKYKELPTLNVNRSHMAIAALNGYVYYGGGMDDTGLFQTFRDFYKMNVATGEVTRLADMPSGGYYACSYGVFDNTIVVANPMSGTNSSATATFGKQVYFYDIFADVWTRGPDTAEGLNQGQCTFLGDTFYRIGGRSRDAWSKNFSKLGPF